MLFGRDLSSSDQYESKVKEFRVYIHEELGYINTFLIHGSQPHIVVPGYDKRLALVRSQLTRYIVKCAVAQSD